MNTKTSSGAAALQKRFVLSRVEADPDAFDTFVGSETLEFCVSLDHDCDSDVWDVEVWTPTLEVRETLGCPVCAVEALVDWAEIVRGHLHEALGIDDFATDPPLDSDDREVLQAVNDLIFAGLAFTTALKVQRLHP